MHVLKRFWMCFFFFFSSRRRHTRLQGDWSSDVCSSDLGPVFRPDQGVEAGRHGGAWSYRDSDGHARAHRNPCRSGAGSESQDDLLRHGRSEEHTSELQSPCNLVCRLLLEKKKKHPSTYT